MSKLIVCFRQNIGQMRRCQSIFWLIIKKVKMLKSTFIEYSIVGYLPYHSFNHLFSFKSEPWNSPSCWFYSLYLLDLSSGIFWSNPDRQWGTTKKDFPLSSKSTLFENCSKCRTSIFHNFGIYRHFLANKNWPRDFEVYKNSSDWPILACYSIIFV